MLEVVLLFIYLIRHGESEADLLQVHEGWADFSLTETGKKQAYSLGLAYQHVSFDKIFCSTLNRAKETADSLMLHRSVPITYTDELKEWNNGVLAGLPREEAMRKYPMPPNGRKLHASVEKGESELAFRYRCEIILSKILAECEEKQYNTIAIVSHGGTTHHLLSILLNQSVHCPTIRFRTGDTGVHIIEKKHNQYTIHTLNSTSHTKQ